MHLVGSKQCLIPYTLGTEDFLMTMMPAGSICSSSSSFSCTFPFHFVLTFFLLQCLPAFSYVPCGAFWLHSLPCSLVRCLYASCTVPDSVATERSRVEPAIYTPSSSFFYSASCSELKSLDVITFLVATGRRTVGTRAWIDLTCIWNFGCCCGHLCLRLVQRKSGHSGQVLSFVELAASFLMRFSKLLVSAFAGAMCAAGVSFVLVRKWTLLAPILVRWRQVLFAFQCCACIYNIILDSGTVFF
jgi:hypothetical protein